MNHLTTTPEPRLPPSPAASQRELRLPEACSDEDDQTKFIISSSNESTVSPRHDKSSDGAKFDRPLHERRKKRSNIAPPSLLLNMQSRPRAQPRTNEALQARIDQLNDALGTTNQELRKALSRFEVMRSAKNISTPERPESKSSPPSNTDLTPEMTVFLAIAQRVLDVHIKDLGKYNAIKDTAMTMLGIIADRKATTVRELMQERDISEDD
jgi:hypothetical protein